MTSRADLRPLLEPLDALQRLLNRFPGRGMIIGGIAVSFLGRSRLTVDLDAVLMASAEEIPVVLRAASQEGIEPRADGALDFARRHRVLLLRHLPSQTNIDVSLGVLPFEQEAVGRSREVRVAGLALRLPTPEDLIIMKAVAHRPRDLEDIQGIIDSNSRLDKSRIEAWVRQFAEALEMPELWEDIAGMLKAP